jgi:hydrogenase nickel incorporation protein HypA/HybF
MHEVSLCEGVVGIVRDAQAKYGFNRIARIRLEIGALSHVEPNALRHAFPPVALGTAAEGAELIIDEPSGKAWCADCNESVTIGRRGEPCPQCQGFRLLVQSGDEMRVKDMEIA